MDLPEQRWASTVGVDGAEAVGPHAMASRAEDGVREETGAELQQDIEVPALDLAERFVVERCYRRPLETSRQIDFVKRVVARAEAAGVDP